jgi:hypothetical protein
VTFVKEAKVENFVNKNTALTILKISSMDSSGLKTMAGLYNMGPSAGASLVSRARWTFLIQSTPTSLDPPTFLFIYRFFESTAATHSRKIKHLFVHGCVTGLPDFSCCNFPKREKI